MRRKILTTAALPIAATLAAVSVAACSSGSTSSAGAPASTGALLSLLEPLTATVLSVAFLGNRLGPAGIAGAVLLAAAVLAAARPGD